MHMFHLQPFRTFLIKRDTCHRRRLRVSWRLQKNLIIYQTLMQRAFATGKKNIIGFIVPDISNRFFATIIEAVESTLSQHNYRLIIANTKELESRELAHLSYFSSGVVDGLLIASTLDRYENIVGFLSPNLPVLFTIENLTICPPALLPSPTPNQFTRLQKS